MERLFGRRTSRRFQEFFAAARGSLRKPIKFLDSRRIDGPWKAYAGRSNESASGIQIWINAGLETDHVERLACHEIGHSLLINEGFARVVLNTQEIRVPPPVSQLATVLYCGVADVLVDERLPSYLSLKDAFEREIQASWDKLKTEDPKDEEAGEYWPHVLGMYLKTELFDVAFQQRVEYLQFLTSLRPKTATAAKDIVRKAQGEDFRDLDGFWSTVQFGLETLDLPHVALASVTGRIWKSERW